MQTLRLGKLTAFMAGWGGAVSLVLFALAILSPTPAEAGSKKYYLTNNTAQGDQALTACDPGFHMASLWEIRDPSNLDYDTARGLTLLDSGAGPPTFGFGWVRTGFTAQPGGPAGEANCIAWTSNIASVTGTTIHLPSDWTTASSAISPWQPSTMNCASLVRVWCIHD